jgi:cbb3-type cytochrome oxidase cytochrome c subunit
VVKNRTKEWLQRFIEDPQAISPWSIMPKYDLSQEDLSNLADFILSLDFDSYGVKSISRQEVIGEN